MKNRSYKTFAEIDKDIQIAKLERDIHREKIFLHTERVRNNISPTNLLNNIVGESSSKGSSSLIMNIVNLALPFIVKKFK